MMSWWFLVGSIALGWWIVILLDGQWRWWIQAALSVVIGFLATAWLSLLLSLILRSTNAGITVTNVLLTVPLVWVARIVWERRKTGDRFIARLVALVVAALPVLALFWLHTAYGNSDGGLSLHGYSWGDIPLHMTLASFFAEQARPILELPLLPHTALTYPFLIDWQAGVLRNLGAGWITAMAVPGALLFASAGVLSVRLVAWLAGTTRAAGLHLALFLGIGSAGGLIPLIHDFFTGSPIWSTDYSNMVAQNLDLANPVTSHFLPQRSFLFGFAAAMALFVILYDLWQKERWPWLLIPSIGIGLLPLVHVHTALITMGWWTVVASLTMWRKPASRRWLGIALVAMFLIALPQLWWQFSALPNHFGTWKVGWMWNGQDNLVVYWVKQLGITLPLILLGAYLIRPRFKDHFLLVGLLGGVALFVAGNVRLFHPSDFDNLKFMLYGFWILLIPVAYLLDRLSHSKATLAVPLLIALMIVVGAHAIIRDVIPSSGYEIFSQDDLKAAEDLQSILPLDAMVATTERHNNMIAALVGRRVLAGYSGWLWSYGLDYQPSLQAEKSIVLGEDDGTLTKQYGVDYIAVHTRDGQEGVANLEKLRDSYYPVYQGYGWVVYRTAVN